MTKRRTITKAMRRAVIESFHGRCARCCKSFEPGERVDIDHHHQLATGGADEFLNWRPLHPWCHAIKTREDAKVRGKIRRLNGTTPKRRGKPIRSRGFDTSKSRRLDGTVVSRPAPRASGG